MTSMEPAVAALLAMALLGEYLNPVQWLAIGCVRAASKGTAMAAARPAAPAGQAQAA